MTDQELMAAAIAEARAGRAEGGVPSGPRWPSTASCSASAATSASRRARRSSTARPTAWRTSAGSRPRPTARATLYTTLSPCDMCTGAILLYGIPRVVIGENSTFLGNEALLRARGVELVVLDDPDCVEMMRSFIAEAPELWNEDIGV